MMKNSYKLLLLLPAVCWGWVNLRTPSYVEILSKERENKATWKGAQDICRQNYTDLASIRNQQEMQLINPGAGWIGLYRPDSEWRWSRGDEIANFTYWHPGEPQSQPCVSKELRGKDTWSTIQCGWMRDFICSEERLVLVKEKKTWEEAVEHCRALEPEEQEQEQGYELATLCTPDDLAFARERAVGATTDEVWTGLRHLAGHWLWVAGEEVLDNQLPVCAAEASCGALLVAGSRPIHMRNCQIRNNFLCSKKHQFRSIEL